MIGGIRVIAIGVLLAACALSMGIRGARAQASVEVTEFNTFKNSIGALVIQGLIENKGTSPVEGVEVAVSLLGAGGSTVGAAQAYATPNVLQPGARGAWKTLISGPAPYTDIRIQAQARPASGFASALWYYDLETSGVSTLPSTSAVSGAKIVGQVTDTGAKTATLVQIVAAVYAADGSLFEVRDGLAKLNEIPPGQSAPFEITFLGGRGIRTVGKYDLFLQSLAKN